MSNSESDQQQKPNRSFQMTLPNGKTIGCVPGCLMVFGVLVLGFIGLFSVISAVSPYKISCSGRSSFYKEAFMDQASAEAKFQEQTQQGMQCSKEYKLQ